MAFARKDCLYYREKILKIYKEIKAYGRNGKINFQQLSRLEDEEIKKDTISIYIGGLMVNMY